MAIRARHRIRLCSGLLCDTANTIASLSMLGWFRRSFLDIIDIRPSYRVLDVCADTNAVGIGLLERAPDIKVVAGDRSSDMLKVGSRRATDRGFSIESVISDVHGLLFRSKIAAQ
ncbi:MAG: class I SAM-dependent methyltransferase [Gammaproteobacteria bacterium]|nr:class I SAM-dependent methyltransferase [Gammaproteobacteria bacterium]MDH3464745.1 class I SAM-dependent methyltransferase [Gammaproteobacteria bacterium]